MKKKIFITGAVREYDSANPQQLADEIKEYICNNLVNAESADAVSVVVDEPVEKAVRIRYPFTPGKECDANTISREMYRCFTGEYHGFVAKNSCWWTLDFGPSFPMNVRFAVEDIITDHKKNTRFYKANRYKDISITENEAGLEVLISF